MAPVWKIESLPINFDGWLNLWEQKPKDGERNRQQGRQPEPYPGEFVSIMTYTHTPYVSPHEKIVLALDIETLPLDSAETRAEIAAGITPPGNMSRPETIAAGSVTANRR